MGKHLNVSNYTSTSKLVHFYLVQLKQSMFYFVLLSNVLFGIKSQYYDEAHNLRSYYKIHDSKMVNL